MSDKEEAPDIRKLPASYEAERGVLGSMCIGGYETIDEVSAVLEEESFHHPAHRICWRTLLEMRDRKEPVEYIALSQKIEDAGFLGDVGGRSEISNLFMYVPTAANVDYYVSIVAEKKLRRDVIARCTECVRSAFDEAQVSDALLRETVEQALFGISQGDDGQKGPVPIREVILQAVDRFEQAYSHRGRTMGISTGIPKLDRMTGGLTSQFYVIAARPSCGKTALGVQLAHYAAVQHGVPALIFSLEMAQVDVAVRMLCSQAETDLQKARDGFLSKADFPKLTEAAGRIGGSPLFIDDTPAISIGMLRSRARRAKLKWKLGLIVVDYLQLATSASKRAQENRYIEIGEISNGLKALQRELDIPVIALAQLNRDGDRGKPKLAHLRESGSIEQDADVVFLLSRTGEEDPDEPGTNLNIAKHRNGPTGDILLHFDPEFTRFRPRAEDGKLYSNKLQERQLDV